MGTLDHAFFYNSQNKDRVYDADSFSEWLRKFFTTGVFINELQVTAGEGMQINIAGGYSNINGKVKLFATSTQLDVTTAHSRYNRIDNVVIERNDTLRDFEIKIVTGGATDTPTAPALIRNNAIYQICLAQITVKAGSTAITQADIKDTRPDPALCGFVAATVKEIDFSQIQMQFDSYFSKYKTDIAAQYSNFLTVIQNYNNDFNAAYLDFTKRSNQSYNTFVKDINDYEDDLQNRGETQLQNITDDFRSYETASKAEFDEWFKGIKEILDGDTAGKIMNLINKLYENTESTSYLDSVQNEGTTVFGEGEVTTSFTNGSGEHAVFNDDGSIVETFTDKLGNVIRKVKTSFEGNTVKTEVLE